MKKELLVGVSVVALGFAVASTASANPKNKFSDGSTATVTVGLNANDITGDVFIESNNDSVEVFATNILTATFDHGHITMGDAAAAAAATAAATADASATAAAAATAAATATSAATADASASASSAASTNTAGSGNVNIQNGLQDASASAAAAATLASSSASASADASADASAAAAADASAAAAADAAAARGGDLVNASIVLQGNAMQRAAGAFAMNLVTGQFVNANAANAIAANVSSFVIRSD